MSITEFRKEDNHWDGCIFTLNRTCAARITTHDTADMLQQTDGHTHAIPAHSSNHLSEGDNSKLKKRAREEVTPVQTLYTS